MALQAKWELKNIEVSPQRKALLTKSHKKAPESPKAEKSGVSVLGEPSKAGANSQSQSHAQNEVIQTKMELKNILVPTDFSDASKKALSYVASLAKKVGGKITLVHVIEPLPDYSEALDPVIIGSDFWLTQARKSFRTLCEEGHVAEALVRTPLIREGTPHHEITEAARESAADLIIIATNGRTGLAHVLLGSTTERVVRHAPCPVLVVREKEREFVSV